MKIVASSSMPYVAEAFGLLGEVDVRSGREITAEDVRDADMLVVRSTTPVTRELLAGSSVRFVGTATIGTDHMDLDYLAEAGIAWCSSAGCNANSVGEYMVAALLVAAKRGSFELAGRTLGIVGVGNVGSRVLEKAEALGMRVLLNDPPKREEAGGERYRELTEVLPEADIVTLHVPLTRDGRWPTWHLADERFFARLKAGAVVCNSARGPILETDALLRALDAGTVSQAIIDTWEGEPAYRADLLPRTTVATPHIAGYSYDGKVNGTVRVYEEACRFLDIPATWNVADVLPPALVPRVDITVNGRSDEDVLRELVGQVYDLAADDRTMREGARAEDAVRGENFDRQRNSYPQRREFPHTTVSLSGATAALRAKVQGLGFVLAGDDDRGAKVPGA